MSKTYGQVRDWVRLKAGEACGDLTEIEVTMQSVLLDMANRLGPDETILEEDLAISAGTASYAVPADWERTLALVDEDGCAIPAHLPSCSSWPCSCSVGSSCPSWKDNGSTITIVPTPTSSATWTLKGLGPIDATLYDTESDVRVWRTVALPSGLHDAYQEAVLALTFGEHDPGRAMYFQEQSNQHFESWRSRQRRGAAITGESVGWAKQALRRRPRGGHVETYRLIS